MGARAQRCGRKMTVMQQRQGRGQPLDIGWRAAPLEARHIALVSGTAGGSVDAPLGSRSWMRAGVG